jgi:hypothetical protein
MSANPSILSKEIFVTSLTAKVQTLNNRSLSNLGSEVTVFFADSLEEALAQVSADIVVLSDNVNNLIHLPVDYSTGTLSGDESYVLSNTAQTLFLPASPVSGTHIKFKHQGTGELIIDGNGKLIDSETSWILEQYDSFELIYNGTAWGIF